MRQPPASLEPRRSDQVKPSPLWGGLGGVFYFRNQLAYTENHTMTATNAKIVAILTALPGKASELQALLSDMAPSCRAEPGNLRWDIWQDKAKPERFILDELYIDAGAVEAHRETPHFKNYASKINGLAERTAYVVTPVDLG